MPDFRNTIERVLNFVQVDIWRLRSADLGRTKGFFVKVTRILLIAFYGFNDDNLPLRASALTFYSLLSLVPVLAMAFGIAKGFGFQKMLERQIVERFSGHEAIMEQLLDAAERLLESTQGGLIAGIGIAILFWTVIKLLEHIELAFNLIWSVNTPRTLGRKFSDYLSMMMIAPLLLILSGGLTVFITTQITVIIEKVSLLGFFSPIIFFMLQFLPYAILWLLLSLVYILMPNTKVSIRSGFIGGILAGTAVQTVQWIYITFQVGAARYNAIYGSFAALPLFLIWLQASWMIVLVGAEISFAHQNAGMFDYEPEPADISARFKKLLSLYIVRDIVHRFSRREAPQTAFQISKTLEIPIKVASAVLNQLLNCGIISVTEIGKDQEPAFQPAFDIHLITVFFVLNAIDSTGNDHIPVKPTPAFDKLSRTLTTFEEILQQSPENRRLMDL